MICLTGLIPWKDSCDCMSVLRNFHGLSTLRDLVQNTGKFLPQCANTKAFWSHMENSTPVYTSVQQILVATTNSSERRPWERLSLPSEFITFRVIPHAACEKSGLQCGNPALYLLEASKYVPALCESHREQAICDDERLFRQNLPILGELGNQLQGWVKVSGRSDMRDFVLTTSSLPVSAAQRAALQ